MENKHKNSISSHLKSARESLKSISDSPALDAELLLAHCLHKNQTYLHTWPEHELSIAQQTCFLKQIEKRLTDYPVAYLLGKKAFWTLDLNVTPDVLIPRPETELLVEVALDKISHLKKPKILDLGTGSGAIALALASEREDAQIFACDYSQKALEVAKLNAKENNLLSRVTFIRSDWFSNIIEKDFDLIVSNPPYIDPDDPHLQYSIKHEPLEALIADNMGFSDIETIIKKSPAYLNKQGFLIIEHGFEQSEVTLKLFSQNGFINPKNYIDLNKNPRISFAQWL